MRLFAAISPPPAALDHLSEAVGRLQLGRAAATGRNVRLTARSLWHVTVVFLGEVPDSRRADAEEALTAGVDTWRAAGGGARQLRLAGGGRFGRGAFVILWAGLAGDVAALLGLSDHLRRAARRGRLPYDRKPLRPHLTLARPGGRLPAEAIAADLAALDEYAGPTWPVTEVHLFRSHLGPTPRHESLRAIPLAA